jgi:ATP-binding protein involved in chromosome partitioning
VSLPASYPAGSSSTISSLDPRAAPTARGSFLSAGSPPVSAYNEPVTNREDTLKALEAVIDPELRRSIVELDMVRAIDISANGVVDVTVSLTTPGCPIKGHFQSSVTQAVAALDGVTHVNVYFDVLSDTQKAALQQKLGRASLPEGALAQVANVICVGSGKGGVGKSTLTANLAAALSAEGKRVGVLDADVWGYSIPRMYGLGATRPPVSAARKIVPLESHGVKVMSIGFFVEEDAAVVWRGPMLHKALTQFLQDVEWGALDYLLVDLPPGTGDVSMTLAQLLPQARFLIVTTPQQTAQKVARRSAHMAHKVDLEIAGVIENMSAFTTPSGERFTIFGEGGGNELAEELGVPLLGKVPLTMPLREQADAGLPLVIEDPDDAAAQAIRHVARGLIALSPAELPVLPLVEVGAGAPSGQPAESRKPVGMSLPMA